MVNDIVQWIVAHKITAIYLLAAIVLVVLRKRTPEEWVALGERSPRWQGVIRAARGAGFDVVKVISGLTQAITGRIPSRVLQAVDTIAPPPRRPNERGFVTVAFLVVMLCLVMVFLVGCPNWNRPECPTPGIFSCVAGQPHYCAPTKELTPIGDEPCRNQGRVCALNDAGVARCALAPDAAVIADGGAL